MLNLDDFYRNAASFDELLSDDFFTDPALTIDPQRVRAMLSSWCDASGAGNSEAFVQRLAKDGWSLEFVSARFAGARPKRSRIYPLWVRDAQWVFNNLQSIMSPLNTDSLSSSSGGDEVELILKELAQLCLEKCFPAQSNGSLPCLRDEAFSDLQETLVNELRIICYKPFVDYFAGLVKVPSQIGNVKSCLAIDNYEQDAHIWPQTHLMKLFQLQPVLLRLIAVIVREWMSVTATLMKRIHEDKLLLQNRFSVTFDTAQVLRVFSISQTIKILEYSNNKKIIYALQNCNLTQRIFDLLEQLNHYAPPIDLKYSNIIFCTDYYWLEVTEGTVSLDDSENAQLYERLGAWMALFYVLAGSHFDDAEFLSVGEYPLPLEIQCLFQSDTIDQGSASSPHDEPSQAPEGVNNAIGQISSLPLTLFRTDETFSKLDQHFDYLLDGFKKYLIFVMVCRDKVGLNGLLERFENQSVRVQYRPNKFYRLLLARMKKTSAFSDGVLWSVQSDFLARFYDVPSALKSKWTDLRFERQALLNLQIPFLTERVEEIAALEHTEKRNIEPLVTMLDASRANLSNAQQRLKRLAKSSIDEDVLLLRSVLWPSVIYNKSLKSGKLIPHGVSSQDENQVFLNEAHSIVQIFTELALKSSAGVTWHRSETHGVEENSLISKYSLYAGSVGIGIFLAAYAEVNNHAESFKLSLAAVADVRSIINSSDAAAFASSIGIGGGTGLGSIVYGLTVISKLFDNSDMLADATKAAKLVSVELIAKDRGLDIIAGSAGAVLGLLKLYRETGDPDILERALLCGNHLLALARYNELGQRYWAGEGSRQRHLNGMSHGASGFGYAFALLAEVSGQNKFLLALEDSLKNEDQNFNPEVSNWFLLETDTPLRKAPCQWCHGAVGIGIARMAIASKVDSGFARFEMDIKRAVRGASLRANHSNDSLCCGSLGYIELLKSASLFFSNPKSATQAQVEFKKVIANAHRSGKYLLVGIQGEMPLGLFTGLAGVGYSALRQLQPKLPNILIWE